MHETVVCGHARGLVGCVGVAIDRGALSSLTVGSRVARLLQEPTQSSPHPHTQCTSHSSTQHNHIDRRHPSHTPPLPSLFTPDYCPFAAGVRARRPRLVHILPSTIAPSAASIDRPLRPIGYAPSLRNQRVHSRMVTTRRRQEDSGSDGDGTAAAAAAATRRRPAAAANGDGASTLTPEEHRARLDEYRAAWAPPKTIAGRLHA